MSVDGTFKDRYSVLPWPRNEFDNTPVYLKDQIRKKTLKQFNEDRRNAKLIYCGNDTI